MPVSDIIGTNPAGDVEVPLDGTPEASGYYGPDPDLTKRLFGFWSVSQVATGVGVGLWRWNYDLDDSFASSYEKVFRTLSLAMILPYLPGAVGWIYLNFLNEMETDLFWFNVYYIMNYISYGAPMLGYFIV
mgnify:CR=1 FL=1